MRPCRTSMNLLRATASPHHSGVSSARWCYSYLDASRSCLPRFICLAPTLDSLRAHAAVMRLEVYGLGCDCAHQLCCSCCGLRLLNALVMCSSDGAAPVSTRRTRRCRSRLSVGHGCVSLLDRRAVMRLVVSERGCGCVGPACSCHVRGRVRVMVLVLSRRLMLVTAAVNVFLSVGR